MDVVKVQMAKAFRDIHKPYRYKVFYGGRGSGKSTSVAKYLLLAGKERPLRILCAREFQSSIKESVKQLLEDLIVELKLESFYTVLTTEIKGINGTSFVFAGLRHNISNIKSMHDVDKCWVEEAQVVSDASWAILIPTIRAENSEIIITMNPEIEEDPSYQRFIYDPPPNSLVVKVNHDGNPFFPEVLKQEMETLKKKDYEEYLHVWEGECRKAVRGAIFARQIEIAVQEGRITEIDCNPSVPVNTYWDLGKRNKTAIWFAQYAGMQWRMLKCITGFGKDLEEYLDEIELLPYNYGIHYLPHDAQQDRLGMSRSVEDQVRERLTNVEVVPRVAHKINAIEAAKAIFPLCWFHKTDCADGLHALRRYAYKVGEDGKVSKEPDHMYSDAADAFQCFAMSAQPYTIEEEYATVEIPTVRLG